jgi:hypothetical protein
MISAGFSKNQAKKEADMKINFAAIKSNFFSFQKESTERIPLKDMSLMDHLEKIVTLSQKYGIDRCQNKGKIHFDYITQKLGISNIQAVLFSHFMEMSNDPRIMVSEIAQSIKCSTIRILKYLNDCEELEKKRLIRCSRNGSSISFRVPCDVRDSLRKYNEFRPERRENLSIGRFFSVLKKLFEERDEKELSSSALYIELNSLIKVNMHLEFCKKITSCNLNWSDFILLICFCHLAGNNDDNYIGDHDLEFLDDSTDDIERFDFSINKLELTDGSHNLIKGNYVEFASNGGFKDSEHWKLTDKANKDLLTELKGKKNFKKNMVLFNTIQRKKMFYNHREAFEVEKISSLLQEDNFLKIQNRLDDKGMRKGFACLFSGGPGTGKTETVYQIARLTKRNIMAVDISATKSCWYGESEKKIKEIFDNYRHAVENSKTAPILLFNEADAVIGKRKINNENNHSIDQTENTIQNIILQEMENLNGILIATSNLVQNMDKAFERRFLYKIKFEKPSLENRSGIWQSLLSDLPENQAAELSKRFELSGGQIENIARKVEVDWITEGKKTDIAALAQYCKDEVQNDFNASKKIGFCQ